MITDDKANQGGGERDPLKTLYERQRAKQGEGAKVLVEITTSRLRDRMDEFYVRASLSERLFLLELMIGAESNRRHGDDTDDCPIVNEALYQLGLLNGSKDPGNNSGSSAVQ